jgi:peptidoglycan-associated lipoprotein
MRTTFWTGLILIVAIGFVGCKTAVPPPTMAPPPVTRIEPPPPPPAPEMGMREPGIAELPMAPPVRAPMDIAFDFAENMRKVHFEFDKSRLTEEAKAVLQENAAWLRQNPDIAVQIEGHCDERGTIEYNLALGERRAMSARNYMASLGIDPNRLFTISYGEERPAVLGHDEDAWTQNRRAEFKIAQ